MNEVVHLPTGLTLAEVESLGERLGKARSPNTIRAYRVGWESWREWAHSRGLSVCPARPVDLAVFFDQRAKTHALKTLRLVKTAIGQMHYLAGNANPCNDPIVAHAFGAIRRGAPPPKQARPLTAAALAKLAKYTTARDAAMLRVMRDGLLRVGEAAALTWGDIEHGRNGDGTFHIARSKTDQAGKGYWGYLSPAAMRALARLAPGQPHARVFALSASYISRRIKTLAIRAGLGAGYSGHSPRVGMAVDLAERDVDLPALMQVGRWKSSAMPARYTEQVAAARNAVARYYQEEQKDES